MEKQLTAKEKRDSNFCDAQRMIYYDLPVLVSKIFHAALINCEYGSPVMCIEDLKFIQGFIEETEKTFNIAMKGQKQQIIDMLNMRK